MDPQLYNAVRCGDENFIRELQSSDETTLPKVTPQTGTVLHVAARFRKTEIAKLILEWHPSLLCQKNSKGDTPLHIAARIGDSDMVRLLVNHKVAEIHQTVDEADEKLVRIINMKGETALHDAVRGGHLEVVKLLIEKDPLLATVTTVGGESPLFLAVERMDTHVAAHILSILSNDAPSCSLRGRNGMNALHAAIIRSCDLDFIKELLGKSPSAILEADNSGRTALHHAASLGEQRILEELLSTDNSNSIAYATDKEGMTALHIAAKEGRVDIMQKLAQKCPNIWDLVDNKGQTALHVATKIGKPNIFKLILKEVPDDIINQQDDEGNSSLHLAALDGNSEIVELLIEDGRADETAINNKGVAFMDILLSMKKDPELPLEVIECGDARRLASLERVINERNEIGTLSVNEVEPTKKNSEDNKEVRKDHIPAVTVNKGDTNKKGGEEAKELANANVVVATLIAGVSFMAAVAVPGGYESRPDDNNPQNAGMDAPAPAPGGDRNDPGMAVLLDRPCFKVFILSNSLAFAFSLGSLLSHFLNLKKREEGKSDADRLIRLEIFCSVVCLLVAYMAGTYAVLVDSDAIAISSTVFCVLVAVTVGLEELVAKFVNFFVTFFAKKVLGQK